MPTDAPTCRSNSPNPTSSAPSAGIGLRPICGIAPWAITPSRSTRIRSAPLAQAHTSPASGSHTITPSMPSAASGEAAKCLAPSIIPSSSANTPTMIRPRNPDSSTARAAWIIAATPDFMSAEPRPRRNPSTTSPANGSNVHDDGSPSVTTSVWPSNISVRPGPVPSRTATTFGRPGATSVTVTSQPKSRITPATRSAAGCSTAAAPGSLTVRNRTRRAARSTTESASMPSVSIMRILPGRSSHPATTAHRRVSRHRAAGRSSRAPTTRARTGPPAATRPSSP